MYRLLSLVVILVATEACRPPPCHWNDSEAHQIDKYFDDAVNELIRADRRAKEYCESNTQHRAKYLFGENEFKMVIKCPGFKKNQFDVKSRNRALLISARNCDSGETFSEVRLMPQYLNIYQSNWAYENNEFILTVPYAFGRRYGSWQKTCNDVNEAIQTVPEAQQTEFNQYEDN